MRFILASFCALFLGTLSFGQPMILEWERDLSLVNDTLEGFSCHGIGEDPATHRLYAFGMAVAYWWEFDSDSSDGWVTCLSSSGDSLWTRILDGDYVQSIGQITFEGNGNTRLGASGITHFRLDGNGNVLSEWSMDCAGLNWECDGLVLTDDSVSIFAGKELVNTNPEWLEITCILGSTPDGQLRWSRQFNFGDETYCNNIAKIHGNQIRARLWGYSWHGDPPADWIFTLDSTGNTVSDALLINTPAVYFDYNGEVTMFWDQYPVGLDFARVDEQNNVLVESHFPTLVSRFTSIVPAVGGGYLLSDDEGNLMCIGSDGDSLWTGNLGVHGLVRLEPLHDGYLIQYRDSTWDYPETVKLRKYSVEFPYLLASRDTIDFGLVPRWDTRILPLVLTNAGPDSLHIDSILHPEGFHVDADSMWIDHREIELVHVWLQPWEEQLYSGELLIYNNTTVSPLSVHLQGDSRASDIEVEIPRPEQFTFLTPYPNPFNATTTLTFSLARATHATLDIFDIQGRLVERVADQVYDAGEHLITWDAKTVASGIYFAEMRTATQHTTQKLMLLK